MTRWEDIQALLSVADELFEKMRVKYEESLEHKSISPELPVYIKNYLENLRSPLDYIACEIAQDVLKPAKQLKPYYPIACNNRADFDGRIKKNLPGLETIHPKLFSVIESLQSYHSNGCKSLPGLSRLVNENKHSQLSEQERIEERGLRIEFPGGAGFVMGPGSSIQGGGMISSGGGWFTPAGGVVSGDSPARMGHNLKQTVERWVSFTFQSTGDEVLPLLRGCRNDLDRIIAEVGFVLWPK